MALYWCQWPLNAGLFYSKWEENFKIQVAVQLIEQVHSIWGPLNTGVTVILLVEWSRIVIKFSSCNDLL